MKYDAEQPPPGLADRLAAALPARAAAVRPLPGAPQRALAFFGLLLGTAVSLGFALGGKGWHRLEAGQAAWLLGPALMLLAAAAMALGERMVPGARVRWRGEWLAAGAAVMMVAWTLASTQAVEQSLLFYGICLAYTSAGVLFSTWLALRCWRRGWAPGASGRWLAGGACALVGFVAVELFCPYQDTAHILSSHVLPALVAGLAAVTFFERGSRR